MTAYSMLDLLRSPLFEEWPVVDESDALELAWL